MDIKPVWNIYLFKMRAAALYSLMALLPVTIEGLQLKERSPNSTPAVVGLGFEKTRVPKHKTDKRKRKDKAYAEDLVNEVCCVLW